MYVISDYKTVCERYNEKKMGDKKTVIPDIAKNSTVASDTRYLENVFIALTYISWSSITLFVITVLVGVIFNGAALVHKFATYNVVSAFICSTVLLLIWYNVPSKLQWASVKMFSIISIISYTIPLLYIIEQITVCHTLSESTLDNLRACEGLNAGQECYPAAAMGTVRSNGCLNVTTSNATSIAILILQLLQFLFLLSILFLSHIVIGIFKDIETKTPDKRK